MEKRLLESVQSMKKMNTSLSLYVAEQSTKHSHALNSIRDISTRTVLCASTTELAEGRGCFTQTLSRFMLVPKFDASSWHIPCLASRAFPNRFRSCSIRLIHQRAFFTQFDPGHMAKPQWDHTQSLFETGMRRRTIRKRHFRILLPRGWTD
jgi:hypothetical protein